MATKHKGYLGAFYGPIMVMLDDCNVIWAAGTHGTPALETSEVKEGTGSAKITIASAEAGDIVATHDFVALDITDENRVRLWIKSTKTTELGDLQLVIDETAACAGSPPEEVIDIPALTANTWTLINLALADASTLDAVISVGLKYTANPQDSVVYIDEIRAISSVAISAEDVGTGDGETTGFDLDHPDVDLESLVVKLDGDVSAIDYSVTVKGHIVFASAPANEVAITADYDYWVLEQKGGFKNWSLTHGADIVEDSDFSITDGWKTFQAMLKNWTGSAEQFWVEKDWHDAAGMLLIVKFYEDTGNTLRHEGWAYISGISTNAPVNELINQSISFQGNKVLSYETS